MFLFYTVHHLVHDTVIWDRWGLSPLFRSCISYMEKCLLFALHVSQSSWQKFGVCVFVMDLPSDVHEWLFMFTVGDSLYIYTVNEFISIIMSCWHSAHSSRIQFSSVGFCVDLQGHTPQHEFNSYYPDPWSPFICMQRPAYPRSDIQ